MTGYRLSPHKARCTPTILSFFIKSENLLAAGERERSTALSYRCGGSLGITCWRC
jgi:hypothetical protein